ncbi:DUF4219 domain-containing protein [Cephalotus follicularis]|uniref:DUF4219 domain-containing protein n=1 Tax=Cephalotus follicularis TaxID=3775 RepID=A0A1Q3D4G1_CEPFO|nr:DUF4219 domain-containing protein [Cephalotus follicularis]
MSNKESMCISKPPFFDGNNYSHWKAKMTIFIQALDFNLWDIIIDGPELPHIISQEGIKTLKSRSSYTDDDRKKVQLNAKAKHVIICALNSNEFNRVSSCATAKEMCHTPPFHNMKVVKQSTNKSGLCEFTINLKLSVSNNHLRKHTNISRIKTHHASHTT